MTTSMSLSAFTAIKSLDNSIENVGPGSTGEREVFEERSLLLLKPSHEERAVAMRRLGEDKLWSSLTFHQHLELLKGLTTNKANPRVWIDAFLFRVSAMVQSEKCTVLDLEQTAVQPSAPVASSGFADYATSKYRARIFLSFLTLENVRTMTPSIFFVTEVKVMSLTPGEHISQAIGEMYSCLKSIKHPPWCTDQWS
ncbi:hypothetical protein EDB84DRAFT_1023517 [Lactarius hengduanensis]|nr:hypothetical protein EDB84DRAFT_1023517 [Lactarius hengduanensis]